ncbi:hypothetical protein RHSIM_Rhsim13G0077100 [Rhododendron simsii]|uniref:Uncharacterized protein n=1 Tax=Rhododendron simsii TaxID=118357 RepID=A0A834FZ15_RHOSS|nr:hypothetical protein RHSIM_Rhsim13G0077100 [Rhododendron simsii]
MASSITSAVYLHVIEDVINKVRDEFALSDGPDETVLEMLQRKWVSKMVEAGAVSSPIERSSTTKQTPGGSVAPVHDLNVPYEGTEYETPTADMFFPPTPLQTPFQTPLPGTAQTPLPGTAQTPLPGTAQTPLPGTADNSMYNFPADGTPNDYSSVHDSGGVSEMKDGMPSPYTQQPSAWMNQRTPLSVDVNVAYVEGREDLDRGTSQQPMMQDFFMSAGKRKRDEFASRHQNGGYIPQRDGAGDAWSDHFQVELLCFRVNQGANTESNIITAANRVVITQGARLSSRIPQSDGPIPDPYDDALSTPNIYNYQGVVNEDYNIVNTPAPNDQAGTPAFVMKNDVGDDDDDEPLNEDDDDDELDDLDQGEELNTQHLVLAQFDKVTRTKSRWKCTLKDGIMHINNDDILFNKANGEFDF